MSSNHLTIKKGSPFCSIQAAPRIGFGQFGIPQSGPMDSVSFRGANYMVGNPMWAPCIEITVMGPVISFESQMSVALAGAEVEAFLNGSLISSNQSFDVETGDQLKFGKFLKGNVTYMAIGGEIISAKPLGSAATLVPLQLGTMIQSRMKLEVLSPAQTASFRQLPNFMKIEQPKELQLRTISGPEERYFTNDSLNTFYHQIYVVTKESDRMGYRLHSKAPTIPLIEGIISSGITKGTIQIPKNGQPIIMMPDHQTAGGYPRIGNVITNDLEYLAQAAPGSKISFRKIEMEKAVSIFKVREERISKLFEPSLT